MQNNYDTIANYFIRRATNASAESFNAKIKAFRSQFRGVQNIPFFIFRIEKLYAWIYITNRIFGLSQFLAVLKKKNGKLG